MIEKTKKPSYIITWFIFSTVVLVVFSSLMAFLFYPKINEIKQQNTDTKTKIENYKKLKEKWMTFNEFNKLKGSSQASQTNLYEQSLLKNVDKPFFDAHFVNNKKGEDFNTFFDKKIKKINELENDEGYKKMQESYKNILPIYVENNQKNEEGFMTDFKFVTYIESILYTFNLDIGTKSITVWNLQMLPDYANDKETSSNPTIFYIPYKFDIKWKKSDILDFVYFLENVGSIKVNKEWNIEVFEDNFIKKSLVWFGSWSILENQIIDIENIQISDYIDSWTQTKSKGEDFIDFVKRTQWDEIITVNIDARFYLKWAPDHKIMESIEEMSTKHNELKGKYEKWKNEENLTQEEKTNLDRGISALKELELIIFDIKKDKTDLNNTYKKVLEVNKLLDILQEAIE